MFVIGLLYIGLLPVVTATPIDEDVHRPESDGFVRFIISVKPVPLKIAVWHE